MRRLTAVFLMAALMLGVLAGCGGKAEDNYIVLDENFGAEQYGVGFRNEDIALGTRVYELLDEMIADGKAAEISDKWFGKDILLKDQSYLEDVTIPEGDTSLQDVLDKGEFVLGLDDSFPPMGYRDDQNNVVGFDIDLATEVCARMGVKLVIQPIDWDSKELELSNGSIDCVWNGMSIDDSRLAAMFIPKAYVANTQIIIVPESSGIKTKADLAGKTVGLQKGSTALSALQKDEATAASVKEIIEYEDNVEVYLDLQAGRIDVFVVDEVVGRYLISQ